MSRRKPAIGAESSATARVRLPAWRGAKRCGPYEAGRVYELPHDEAERLVRVKGFEVVGAGPDDVDPLTTED